MKRIFFLSMLIALMSFCSCNNASTESSNATKSVSGIKTENLSYTADSANMTGYAAWDTGTTAKRPVVLIVHEWWGLNDYAKGRARQLAALGYLAFAVDMYGD